MERLTDDDWGLLTSVTEFELGKITLYLEPMGAKKMLQAWSSVEQLQGTRVDNDQLPALILAKAPHLLSLASGLHPEDAEQLIEKAPGKALELATVLFEINAECYEGFVKKLVTLTKQTGALGKVLGVVSSVPGTLHTS